VAEANAAYAHGGYVEAVAFTIEEVRSLVPLHLFVLPRTLGLFTLGAWLWRIEVFRAEKGRVFAWYGGLGVGFGLLLTLATGPGGLLHRLSPAAAVAEQIAPIALALGYAGVILLLARGDRTKGLVAWAAPLGRTAFTNYVLQSLVFGWIFYGYGLGLFGRYPPAPTFVLGVAVYAIQAVVSALWLRHFQFGPLEWLWRALMYGRRPPLRRPEAPSASL
jgi:uncharacterized protein